MTVESVLRTVRETIFRFRMLSHGDFVVVAVSGGADSVCLLDVLHRLKETLKLTLVVAHFDHGLRPDADEYETAHVRGIASALRVEMISKKADPPLSSGDASLEEKARQLRYRFFKDVKKACGADKIATGHTLNDQAETVLMRLLRGSGPKGLSGIQPVREGIIIRPLVHVSRNHILAYLHEGRLQYVTDRSNMDPRYLRNGIRLNLIPQLQAYQPNIIHLLGQTADILREDNRWFEKAATEWIQERAKAGSNGEIALPVHDFGALPQSIRNHVSREVLRRVSGDLRRIGRVHIEAIHGLTTGERPQARISLPKGLLVRRVYDQLIFSKGSADADLFCCFIERIGAFEVDALGLTLTLEAISIEDLRHRNAGPWTAHLDADRIRFPLILRNVRPGDRFVPLGMKGHKKLKDFFVDMKIPLESRARIPLLMQGDHPVWICGLRIDDRFKVTSRTQRVLKVTLTQ